MPRHRWTALLALTSCGLLLSGCTQTSDPTPPPGTSVSPSSADGSSHSPPDDSAPGDTDPATTLPGLPTADRARAALAELEVAEPGSMDGYRRSAFDHWAAQGDNCDTREVVLERDGARVRRDGDCRAVEGSWHSPFDGVRLTDSSEVDVDHLVPLGNAWRSGADDWSDQRRETFANDLEHPQLIAVSAASNRAKGDRSPEDWRPPRAAYHCVYARAWTAVKSTYQLTVNEAEQTALATMLDSCPA